MIDTYEFLKSVIDSIAEHIAVIDGSGNIQFTNSSWNKFSECNNCLITSGWLGINYLHVCDVSAAMGDKLAMEAAEGIRKVINAEQSLFCHEYPCHGPHQKRWFLMRVTPFQLMGKAYYVLSHLDITERKLAEDETRKARDGLEKRVLERTVELERANVVLQREIAEREQAEQSLRVERDRAQLYLKTVEAIIVALDVNGIITLINRKGCELLEYKENELLGKNWFATCLPQTGVKNDVYGIFRKVIAGDLESVEYYENPIVSRSGKQYLIAWHNSYLRDAQGNIVATLGAGEDITKRRQAEEQARQRQAELAHMARLNTVGEMATSIAHELNQPLSAISTYADVALRMLRGGIEQPEKLTEALEGARNQALRASDIIRHLRKFVSKRSPQKEDVNLNELIDGVIELTKVEVRRQNVGVLLELDNNLQHIHVDIIQIEQVLLNLLLNAVESLQLAPVDSRKITIRTGLSNEGLTQVAVTDTGPGMDKETLRKCFEPFVTSKGVQGMGMGLSISRSIIEAHGGHMWAVSEPGQGATFYFTLPAGVC